MRLDDKI